MYNIHPDNELIVEDYYDQRYEYYPLGEYIVIAPGICGGRPTFKYSRLEASMILSLLSTGLTIDEVLEQYAGSKISREAVMEALSLAQTAFINEYALT